MWSKHRNKNNKESHKIKKHTWNHSGRFTVNPILAIFKEINRIRFIGLRQSEESMPIEVLNIPRRAKTTKRKPKTKGIFHKPKKPSKQKEIISSYKSKWLEINMVNKIMIYYVCYIIHFIIHFIIDLSNLFFITFLVWLDFISIPMYLINFSLRFIILSCLCLKILTVVLVFQQPLHVFSMSIFMISIRNLLYKILMLWLISVRMMFHAHRIIY